MKQEQYCSHGIMDMLVITVTDLVFTFYVEL